MQDRSFLDIHLTSSQTGVALIHHLRSNPGSNGPIAKECHRCSWLPAHFNFSVKMSRFVLVRGTGLLPDGWKNAVDHVDVCGLALRISHPVKDGNHVFLRKHHEPLSTETSSHPNHTRPIGSRQKPPFESVPECSPAEANGASDSFTHSLDDHPLAFRRSPMQIKRAELGQTGIAQEQSTFGINRSERRSFPEMIDAHRRKQESPPYCSMSLPVSFSKI